VSKAFTREEDEGLTPVAPRAVGHGALTPMGMGALRGRLEGATARGDTAEVEALGARIAGAVVLEPEDRSVASLGAEVTLRDAGGKERVVRLVTPDEVGLVERGASPSSPIGSAVVGKRVGDDVELPGGVELAVVRIGWPGTA